MVQRPTQHIVSTTGDQASLEATGRFVMGAPAQERPAVAKLAAAGEPSCPRLRLRRDHQWRLTETDRPSVEVVVVPWSDELQAVEDALSLALVALIGGTRPSVTTAMVRDHLRTRFNVDDAAMSVMRHAPEDFIVRFSHREDLEWVLHAPPEGSAPFSLTWWRWTRLSRVSTVSFTFRVLVGIKGVRAHALSGAIAQQLLGSSYA